MKGDGPLERKAALVGGLGSLATQYAKAMGLRTFAVDSGAEKGECCKNTLVLTLVLIIFSQRTWFPTSRQHR